VEKVLIFTTELLSNVSSQIKLQTLDIAGNKILRIENVAHLEELEEFWVGLLFTSYDNIGYFFYWNTDVLHF